MQAVDSNELKDGSVAALAKAITLVESSRSDHRLTAEKLLGQVFAETGRALRIGVSGPPGVGKSTFIEAFGLELVGTGKKVAVLAVDPTSPLTGGSILGDKTRMNELSQHPKAFIRPSPSSLSLGGVGRRTRESILLCEAAGFDVVIVETVGVGQSEYAVRSMTDYFVQLHMPQSGDDLQGIKKGANELCDLVVITKSDGVLADAAELSKREIEHSFHLSSDGKKSPEVLLVSAKERRGIDAVWQAVEALAAREKTDSRFEARRLAQRRSWFEEEVRLNVESYLGNHAVYQQALRMHLAKVETSKAPASTAARQFIESIFSKL